MTWPIVGPCSVQRRAQNSNASTKTLSLPPRGSTSFYGSQAWLPKPSSTPTMKSQESSNGSRKSKALLASTGWPSESATEGTPGMVLRLIFLIIALVAISTVTTWSELHAEPLQYLCVSEHAAGLHYDSQANDCTSRDSPLPSYLGMMYTLRSPRAFAMAPLTVLLRERDQRRGALQTRFDRLHAQLQPLAGGYLPPLLSLSPPSLRWLLCRTSWDRPVSDCAVAIAPAAWRCSLQTAAPPL